MKISQSVTNGINLIEDAFAENYVKLCIQDECDINGETTEVSIYLSHMGSKMAHRGNWEFYLKLEVSIGASYKKEITESFTSNSEDLHLSFKKRYENEFDDENDEANITSSLNKCFEKLIDMVEFDSIIVDLIEEKIEDEQD